MTLMGSGKVWENHGGGRMVAAADPMASGVMDAVAPPGAAAAVRPGIARIQGFRLSSTHSVLSLQHRRRWGWPVSSNSSTWLRAMRNSWK